MKALYTTAPGHYGLTERPVPDPGVDEALIRVAGVGLCSNEIRLRDGVLKIARYPVVPGYQFAGVVESCGPYVESLEPGDRVAVHPYVVCGQCALELAIEVLATRGRIVVEGHFDPAATITLSPSDLLVARSVTLRGNRGFMTPDYTRAHQMLADGVVEVKSLITYRFPLEDWEAAFDRFTDPAQQTAQVLIVP